MRYFVFFDENGNLVGGTIQDKLPEGVYGYVEVFDITIAQTWYNYRLNAAHDGVELIPYTPPPPPTFEEIAAELQAGVQQYLDGVAHSFGYDDLLAAASYADEPADAVFEAEGKALRAWRSLSWRACYTMFAQAAAGTISVPTIAEVIAALPAAPVQADVRAGVAAQGAPA